MVNPTPSRLDLSVTRVEPLLRYWIVTKATCYVLANGSVFFLSGGRLYCCRPGTMDSFPFTDLKSLKIRQLKVGGDLIVARGNNDCIVLVQRVSNDLIGYRMSGKFISAIPSDNGLICTTTLEKGVKESRVFLCNSDSCTLISNPEREKRPDHKLRSTLPTAGGYLEIFSAISAKEWLFIWYPIGDGNSFQMRLPNSITIFHLSVFGEYIAIKSEKDAFASSEPRLHRISWSPPEAPLTESVDLPPETDFVTRIADSLNVIAASHPSRQLWIVGTTGYSKHHLQFPSPSLTLESSPAAKRRRLAEGEGLELPIGGDWITHNPQETLRPITELSVRPDGQKIVWRNGPYVEAVSTTDPPLKAEACDSKGFYAYSGGEVRFISFR